MHFANKLRNQRWAFSSFFFVPLTFRRKLHGQLNDIILCFTINRWGELVYLMLAPKMNLFFGESYSNIYNTTCQRNKYYTLPYMLAGWAEANFLWGAIVNSEKWIFKNSQNLLNKSQKHGGAIDRPKMGSQIQKSGFA